MIPTHRRSALLTVTLGATEVTITTSRVDRRIVELFVDVDHREGAPLRGFANAVARLGSLALQAGTPLDDVIRALRHTPGGPGDVVGLKGVAHAESIPDLLALVLESLERSTP